MAKKPSNRTVNIIEVLFTTFTDKIREGGFVHLPAPKTHFTRDIEWSRINLYFV